MSAAPRPERRGHPDPMRADVPRAGDLRRSASHLIALGRAHGARIVGYHFDSPVRECLARNATRVSRRRVPEVAVYVAAKRLEEPSDAEGFDSLNHVRIVGPSDYEIIGLPPP